MKRMTALLLCIVLMLSLLPVYAAAEEITEIPAEEFKELIVSDKAFLGVSDIKYYEDEPNNVADDANIIGNGFTVLATADGRDYDLDIYRFDLKAESSVQIIAMSSSSMVLFWLEGNGYKIDAEDLGKVNSSSRYYAYLIETTLPAGTYYIHMVDINACIAEKRVAYDMYLEWEETHTHDYTFFERIEPTCTEDGYTIMRCSCGDSYHTDSVEAIGHSYTDDYDATCDACGEERDVIVPSEPTEPSEPAEESVPMYRMYDPNSGEHFYTGAELERDFLVEAGWHYEGVGFNFPREGKPVYRLYDPVYGEHLYTMDEAEKAKLISWGWNDEGVAFNSAGEDEVPQYRLHNPNAKRGGYHFTGSTVERDFLISIGWINEGIGWYSCLE